MAMEIPVIIKILVPSFLDGNIINYNYYQCNIPFHGRME